MRTAFLVALGSLFLAAAGACADSSNDDRPVVPTTDSGVVPAFDAMAYDASYDADADAAPPCSDAGWCATTLPDPGLGLQDIWLLPDRAFAIAESDTLGVKVLEWTEVAGWSYIDDNSQNQGGGQYAGTIWAPSDNEVYFGAAPANIFHGIRTAPGAPWTWTSQRLPDNDVPVAPGDPTDHGHPAYAALQTLYESLGVWGTSATDVYAWYANTVFHMKSTDGGAPTFVADYISDKAEAPNETIALVSGGGSGPDDVWFSGGRHRDTASCPYLVHKTPSGYTKIADGIVDDDNLVCTKRASFQLIDGSMGWVTDLASTGPGQLVALKGAHDVLTISPTTITASRVPDFSSLGNPGLAPSALTSFFKTTNDLWFTGWGFVVRGESGDAGAFGLSTLALNGSPIQVPMYRVRGTSSINLWAIGQGYAFHKTTP